MNITIPEGVELKDTSITIVKISKGAIIKNYPNVTKVVNNINIE